MSRSHHLLAAQCVCAVALFASAPVQAGSVILADGRVPQYRTVIQAARDSASGLKFIDQGVAGWEGQLHDAAPDAVLAVGPQALSYAKAHVAEVPVVFCMVLGGNGSTDARATGVLFEVSAAVQLNYFRQLSPSRKRIGILYEGGTSGPFIGEATRVASSLGLSLVTREVADIKQIRGIAGQLVDQIDALWLLPDPKLISGDVFRFLLALMTERKVPVYGFLDNFTQAGALASVSPDFNEIGRQAVKLLTEAVAKKATHAALPSAVASPGALSLNLRTAQLLGIDVPHELVDKAKQVYR